MNGLPIGNPQRLLMIVALALVCSLARAAESWPRDISLEQGTVTIYPLQIEKLDGDALYYRAALAWRPQADTEPVFGAGWFQSTVLTDASRGLVRPQGIRVAAIRFPEGTAPNQEEFARAVAEESTRWKLDLTEEELDAALQVASAEAQSLQALNTAPPQIHYRDHPALLVTLDGEPLLRSIEDSPFQAVINTPYPLIFDGRRYYLNVAREVWYRADEATGPYRYDASPPSAVAALVEREAPADADAAPAEPVTAANAPEIIVSTVPAELIVTDGPAAFVPLVDDLLVLQNSDDDVFMHVGSQQYYIVLAGRWYRAPRLEGPWVHEPSDQLPPAFARIPPGSAQGDARVHVAGTPEAEEAVLDAQVPQTAAVARGEAAVEVEYDGQPEFRPVDGTDMQYAANSGSAVLLSDRTYYLVEDGVWYVSDTPHGPWVVSLYRPDAVRYIAPTSPVYNTRYVYIYDYTPDVVYVGYTPGYLGSHIHYGTVVYGTGWYYTPWVSPHHYYPRRSTWGFHVSYNPWGGWGFGLSWNWGWGWGWQPYTASWYSGGYWHHHHHWHHRHYGYWGPRGYRPRPAPYHHYSGGHYAQQRPHARESGRYAPPQRHENLYRDAGQRARIAATRDKPAPQRAAYRNTTRQAFKASKTGGQQAVPGSMNRSARQPVKAAELRQKAERHDAARDRGALPGNTRGSARQAVKVADLRQRAAGRNPARDSRTLPDRMNGTKRQPVRIADLQRKAELRDAADSAAARARAADRQDRYSARTGIGAGAAAPKRAPTKLNQPQRRDRAVAPAMAITQKTMPTRGADARRDRPEQPQRVVAPVHSTRPATAPTAARQARPAAAPPSRPAAAPKPSVRTRVLPPMEASKIRAVPKYRPGAAAGTAPAPSIAPPARARPGSFNSPVEAVRAPSVQAAPVPPAQHAIAPGRSARHGEMTRAGDRDRRH